MKKPGFETASKLFPGWSSTVMRRMLETPEKWDDDDIASVRRYLDTLEKLAQGNSTDAP
jgi:phage terminase large subunit-like protein